MNTHQIIDDFKAAMREAGIEPPKHIIADGVLYRFHVEGHKHGTQNGAYILHLDGVRPAGYFEDHKSIKVKWKADGPVKPMTQAERHQFKAEQARRKAEQQEADSAAQQHAAETAKRLWHEAKPIDDVKQHSYLKQKGIQPHQSRLLNNATLILPIYDENKHLVNLQLIRRNGEKRFLKNGRKKGCYSLIGKPQTGAKVLVAEGFATAASLYEATGHPVFVALDKSNLVPVAQVVRAYFATETIVICADADNDGGGQKYAKAAAQAVGGLYCEPPEVGKDFNDIAQKVSDGK